MPAHVTTEDLELLSELIEAGKVRPEIDRHYPFAEIPAAIAYLEQGHARAKDVQTTLGEIRRLVDGLRPPALDELGLVGAIEQQAHASRDGRAPDR